MNTLRQIDQQLFKKAYLSCYGKYLPLKTFIFMGDGPFWLIVLGIISVLGILCALTSLIKLSLLILIGFAVAQLVFIPSKIFLKRRRPYANVELQKDLGITVENRDPDHGSKELESFPSGHLYWTTMAVFFVWHQFGLAGLILCGWMVPVMFYLRLYLGVHYPSDVVAGMILGLLTAMLTVQILPSAFNLHESLEHFSWYPWLYIVVISLAMLIGYRCWLRRI